MKFLIAMAVLHHGTDHPRWGRMLERIGNRNLIQVRWDPDLDLPVFDRVFGAWWGRVIESDGKERVRASAERYVAALQSSPSQ